MNIPQNEEHTEALLEDRKEQIKECINLLDIELKKLKRTELIYNIRLYSFVTLIIVGLIVKIYNEIS